MKATLAAAALVLSVALPSLVQAGSAGCFGAMPTAQSQTSTPVQIAQADAPAR